MMNTLLDCAQLQVFTAGFTAVIMLMFGVALHFIWRFIYDPCEDEEER